MHTSSIIIRRAVTRMASYAAVMVVMRRRDSVHVAAPRQAPIRPQIIREIPSAVDAIQTNLALRIGMRREMRSLAARCK